MTSDQVLAAIALYEAKLAAYQNIEHAHDIPCSNRYEAVCHILSMLPAMRKQLADGKLDKAFRWLGFIQGILWVEEFYTLEALRAHNR